MNARQVILRPIITEASMANTTLGKYTFAVDPRANKAQIKQAVQEVFKVKVRKVNTINMPGKTRRVGVHTGRRPDWKKAVVTLEEGQRIEFFEGLR